MPNELSFPPEALFHRSVEMLRVWLANQKLRLVLNIGFGEERGLDERAAWGLVLADAIGHIADAHHAEFGHDRQATLRIIRKALDAELAHPTSARRGEFVREKRNETDPEAN